MSVSTASSSLPTITAAAARNSASTSNQGAGGNLDVTFLNLLITELKSQDPTSPMDSNQMVGQMVALNQLDQLIGIRQLLQSGTSITTSTATSATTHGGY
jgi:flagellar basal-body rod modification protein FlgD